MQQNVKQNKNINVINDNIYTIKSNFVLGGKWGYYEYDYKKQMKVLSEVIKSIGVDYNLLSKFIEIIRSDSAVCRIGIITDGKNIISNNLIKDSFTISDEVKKVILKGLGE